jgi:hypothetical protein
VRRISLQTPGVDSTLRRDRARDLKPFPPGAVVNLADAAVPERGRPDLIGRAMAGEQSESDRAYSSIVPVILVCASTAIPSDGGATGRRRMEVFNYY